MGQNWNKKNSVEDSKPQWGVIIAILALILLPIIGAIAIFFFLVNGSSTLMLFTIGGLCLLSLSLPLLALYFLRKAANRDDRLAGN